MGFCDYCKTPVPTLELLVHITQVHHFTPDQERWPDGGLFVIPEDFEPADFMEDTAREFLASLRMSRVERMRVWFRSWFRRRKTV